MTAVLAFFGQHVFLAWCALWLLWGVAWVFFGVVNMGFLLINRTLRTIKVVCRGWPPAHIDADGDWKTEIES